MVQENMWDQEESQHYLQCYELTLDGAKSDTLEL